MKSKEACSVQETPIPCKIVYRPIAESRGVRGDNLAFSGGGIQFTGEAPLPMAQAAEVKIDAVKGVSPPLTAYIEVTRCEPGASGGYRMAGVIKGIRSG